MHPDVARREAEDLVLGRILGEMAQEVSTCRSQGIRCDTVKNLTYRQYCDRCKAAFLLDRLFRKKKIAGALAE